MKTRQKPSGWEPTIQQIISEICYEKMFMLSHSVFIFVKNKDIGFEMNWSEERILKIKQLLNLWKQRNLTLKGKIMILK